MVRSSDTATALTRVADNLRAGLGVLLDLERGHYTPSGRVVALRHFLLDSLEAELDVLDDAIKSDCVLHEEGDEGDQEQAKDPTVVRRTIVIDKREEQGGNA